MHPQLPLFRVQDVSGVSTLWIRMCPVLSDVSLSRKGPGCVPNGHSLRFYSEKQPIVTGAQSLGFRVVAL